MSAIDKETMKAARECAGRVLYAHSRGEDISHAIARAILAERQRCADVARNATIKYEMDWRGEVEHPILHRNLIADAILA